MPTRIQRASTLAREIEQFDMLKNSSMDPVFVENAEDKIERDVEELASLGFSPVNVEQSYAVRLIPIEGSRDGRNRPYPRRSPRHMMTHDFYGGNPAAGYNEDR